MKEEIERGRRRRSRRNTYSHLLPHPPCQDGLRGGDLLLLKQLPLSLSNLAIVDVDANPAAVISWYAREDQELEGCNTRIKRRRLRQGCLPLHWSDITPPSPCLIVVSPFSSCFVNVVSSTLVSKIFPNQGMVCVITQQGWRVWINGHKTWPAQPKITCCIKMQHQRTCDLSIISRQHQPRALVMIPLMSRKRLWRWEGSGRQPTWRRPSLLVLAVPFHSKNDNLTANVGACTRAS